MQTESGIDRHITSSSRYVQVLLQRRSKKGQDCSHRGGIGGGTDERSRGERKRKRRRQRGQETDNDHPSPNAYRIVGIRKGKTREDT